jgi:cell division septum initiation protein DivIVA
MAEISVQFSNKLNGYNKAEVNQFVKDAEAKLQEKAVALANLQQQVVELEARLNKITGADASVEEKVELYDKLMKKMDGDYNNLLAPAIAKAKAIEEKAQAEYEVRMDQARATADGIYVEAAERIANVVDDNMDRLYDLLDQFIYSKTLPGRIEAFIQDCKVISTKIAGGVGTLSKIPGKAYGKAKNTCASVKSKVQNKVNTYKAAIAAAKAAD